MIYFKRITPSVSYIENDWNVLNILNILLITHIQPIVFEINETIYKINAFVVNFKLKIALKF